MRQVFKTGLASAGREVVHPDWYAELIKSSNLRVAQFGQWLTLPGGRLVNPASSVLPIMPEVGSGDPVRPKYSATTEQVGMQFSGQSINTLHTAGADFSAFFITEVTAEQLADSTPGQEWFLYLDWADPMAVGFRAAQRDLYINVASGQNVNFDVTAGLLCCLATVRDNGNGTVDAALYVNDFDAPAVSGTRNRAVVGSGETWHIGGTDTGNFQWPNPITFAAIWNRDITENATFWAQDRPRLAAAQAWATP